MILFLEKKAKTSIIRSFLTYGAIADIDNLRYYDLVTDCFEHAWGKSFHFCRVAYGEPFSQAMVRHEHFLAHKLGLQETQSVLDVGCGVGGPAREIARFTGASIIGLNNNDYQIERAHQYTVMDDLSHKVRFVKGDFMQMQFEPSSFDAAYSIEGTSYAPDLALAYAEIFKVLKPGGAFAVYEMVLTDSYDDHNLEHREIRFNLEKGLGLSNLAQASGAINTIKAAGFDLEAAHDLAEIPHQVPWYYHTAGSFKNLNSAWDITRIAQMMLLRCGIYGSVFGTLEKLGIVPPGARRIGDNLALMVDSVTRAGEMKLFTPLFMMVAKKPLK